MIEILKLPSSRWKEYRDLRLEALKMDSVAFGASYEEEKKFLESEWKERMKNVLFALENDKPVGIIVYKFLNKKKVKHIANIYSVYVTKDGRSRGIGKMLMEAAISEIAKNKDIVKINLNVNPEQTSAVKLYESFGFEPVGILKKDLYIDGKYYDEMIMEKLF